MTNLRKFWELQQILKNNNVIQNVSIQNQTIETLYSPTIDLMILNLIF